MISVLRCQINTSVWTNAPHMKSISPSMCRMFDSQTFKVSLDVVLGHSPDFQPCKAAKTTKC